MKKMCALLLISLWSACAQANIIYVSQDTGSDSHTCTEAQQGGKAKATINGGLSCLQSGWALEIAGGTYSELIISQGGSAPNTVPIPNGTPSAPTTIRAKADERVWLMPTTPYPGGAGVVSLFPSAAHLRFEGINIDAQMLHTNGAFLDGADITYTRAEIRHAQSQGLTSFGGTQHVISYLLVHSSGTTDKHHGMYICSQNKIIEYNFVHSHNGYGIQVSCESGGIRNITVRFNRIANNAVRGLQVQGEGHRIHDNLLYRNGIGIGLSGCDISVDHNTIASHLPLPDNWAIITQGCSQLQIRNNLIIDFPVRSFGSSGSRYLYWGSGSPPQQAGNTCDATGMGCQVAVDGWQTLVVDLAGGNLRLIPGSPAIAAGTPLGLTPDIAGLPRTTPDSGAFAWQTSTPEPPDPEPPPTLPDVARCAFTRNGVTLAQWLCEGEAPRRR